MSVRKVFLFSYLDRYASLLLFVVTSMILARLLTPAEMGVFSVTMVFLSFTGPLKDLGASQYIIQEKHLEPAMIRSAWAIQLGLGLLLAIFVLGVSQFVAEFYREPKIKSIMLVLSLNFVLNPFGALTLALLSREMRFGSIAIIRFSGAFSGSLTSITCAWLSFGPISLAYGALTTSIVSALVSLWFRPKGIPWLPSFAGLRRVLTFGSFVTGVSIMSTISQGTPELILGRLQGMAATGLFSRANGLVSMFERLVLDGVYAAALPLFSKRIRDGEPIGDVFVRAEEFVSGIGWPLLSFLAIFAYSLIRLFYGTRWDGAVDLTRTLCMAMIMLIPALLCGPPLIALGKIRTVFLLTCFNAVMQIGLSAIGASIGLEALGIAIVISSLSIAIFWLYISKPLIAFTWKAFLSGLFKSAAVTIGAMAVPLAVTFFFGLRPNAPLIPLIIGGVGALSGYLLIARAVNHPVWAEIDRAVLRKIGFST